jgi:DNA-binding transcriptional regulator YdaS (Cro superfamily)
MTVMESLALSPEATGRLFGVSRQAVNLWLKTGVPADRRASVERVFSLTQVLTQTLKKERIPEIVREPMPGLADRSILSTIAESGPAPVFAMLDRARSYVPKA